VARLTPITEILRALFVRSSNQCAFPGCTQPLINHKNKFIGQVCHIEAALPGGARYNEFQTDEERRAYNNLLLLCYPHHIETDDVFEYSAERLRIIKQEHEQQFRKSDFKIDESELYKLVHEMDQFWNNVERLNKYEHTFNELVFEVDAKASGLEVLDCANEAVRHIEEFLQILHDSDRNIPKDLADLLGRKGLGSELFSDIPYYENPFENRNWEIHNLAFNNCMQSLRISLTHIEVKYLEEYLKTNSNDLIARTRLEKVKCILKDLAQYAAHAD